jgi:hypothetical protein
MMKIRGDNPIGVMIPIHTEISQGNPHVANFTSKRLKCHVFPFLLLFFTIWRTGGWKKSCPGARAGTNGRCEVMEKGG